MIARGEVPSSMILFSSSWQMMRYLKALIISDTISLLQRILLFNSESHWTNLRVTWHEIFKDEDSFFSIVMYGLYLWSLGCTVKFGILFQVSFICSCYWNRKFWEKYFLRKSTVIWYEMHSAIDTLQGEIMIVLILLAN